MLESPVAIVIDPDRPLSALPDRTVTSPDPVASEFVWSAELSDNAPLRPDTLVPVATTTDPPAAPLSSVVLPAWTLTSPPTPTPASPTTRLISPPAPSFDEPERMVTAPEGPVLEPPVERSITPLSPVASLTAVWIWIFPLPVSPTPLESVKLPPTESLLAPAETAVSPPSPAALFPEKTCTDPARLVVESPLDMLISPELPSP